jgi:hypothetical protein
MVGKVISESELFHGNAKHKERDKLCDVPSRFHRTSAGIDSTWWKN